MKYLHIINTFGIRLLFGLLLFSQSAFAFTTLNGKKADFTAHLGKGKWTIVELWESNCTACRMHMPEMVKFDGKLKNARLLGISIDGNSDEGLSNAEDFVDEFDIKFPTLVTNVIEMNEWMLKNVGEGLYGTPTFMLFDPKGKLVAAQPGIVSTQSLETFIKENS